LAKPEKKSTDRLDSSNQPVGSKIPQINKSKERRAPPGILGRMKMK